MWNLIAGLMAAVTAASLLLIPVDIEARGGRGGGRRSYVGGHTMNRTPTMSRASNRADSPIASTGIYNLTEDQTPINVHFTDGSDQNWTLARLEQEK